MMNTSVKEFLFNNYSFLVKRPGNYSCVLFVTDVPQEYIYLTGLKQQIQSGI